VIKLNSAIFILIFLSTNSIFGQKGVIEGYVRDKENSDPMIGATVMVDETNIGTVTDVNGFYRINNLHDGEITILVRYLGYENSSKTVKINHAQKAQLDFKLYPIGILTDEVIITAQAEGQIAAINKQLTSNTIESVISAKKIQEVPDANAAESLGRLPGISILRSGGEGSKIVIRGLAPKYNKVQVEGVKMASTDGEDRSTDLSMVSPYMLEAIEVSKAALPDKEADVLGGSVNFVLREAPKEPKIDFLVQGGYSHLFKDYNNYKMVLGGSKRFFENKFGIFAQIDLEKRNRNSYEMRAGYGNIRISNPSENDTIDVSLTNLYFQHIKREIDRQGAAVVLDYKLNNGSIKFSNFASLIGKDIINRFEDMRPNFRQHIYGLNNISQKTKILTNSISIKNSFGPLEFQGGVSYSFADNYSPDNAIFSGIETNAFNEPLNIEKGPVEVASKAKYAIEKAIVSEISQDSFYTYEDEFALNLNLEYEVNFNKKINLKIKSGYKFKKLNKSYDREYNRIPVSWAGHGAAIRKKIFETYPWMLEHADPNSSSLPYWLFADKSYNLGSFPGGDYEVKNIPQMEMTNTILDISEDFYFKDHILSNKDDYNGTETYNAAYLMGTLKVGKKITLIPGVRYENNSSSYTANRGNSSFLLWNEGYAFNDTSIVNSNSFLLPMIHFKYKPKEWLDIRLAYTQTLARPDFKDIVPKWNIEDFSIQWNNPYLKPSFSHNYDIYCSVYDKKIGLFSVGGFHKNIFDLIYNTGYAVILDASEYGLPENELGTPITKIINNIYPAKLWGIEAEWQTRLWYFNNFLKGFVLTFNYTHTKSEVKYPKTEIKSSFIQEPPYQIKENIDTFYIDRLLFQPKDIFNVTIGYDYKGFSSRFSFIFQDRIFSYTNFYERLRGESSKYYRIDFSVRQKLPWKGVEALLNISNITSTLEKDVNVATDYSMREQHYGVTIDLGFRYRL
jgi:outer membrane receptor protein involved in Fe transport